jgi:hypothetical protein
MKDYAQFLLDELEFVGFAVKNGEKRSDSCGELQPVYELAPEYAKLSRDEFEPLVRDFGSAWGSGCEDVAVVLHHLYNRTNGCS